MMSAYYEVLRNLVFRSIQRETRLSERQVAQLRWEQIVGNTITTKYHREVVMSDELVAALDLLPHSNRLGYVFMGTSPRKRDDPGLEELRKKFEAEDRAKRPKKLNFIHVNWGVVGLTKAQ